MFGCVHPLGVEPWVGEEDHKAALRGGIVGLDGRDVLADGGDGSHVFLLGRLAFLACEVQVYAPSRVMSRESLGLIRWRQRRGRDRAKTPTRVTRFGLALGAFAAYRCWVCTSAPFSRVGSRHVPRDGTGRMPMVCPRCVGPSADRAMSHTSHVKEVLERLRTLPRRYARPLLW